MSTHVLDIYVPCRTIPIAVTLSPVERLSRIESLALRALGAGVSSFNELRDLLQLDHRPTLDLISDLWRRGYVYVNLDNSELRLAEYVQTKVQAGKLDELLGGEVCEREERVTQELLSGHVIRPQRRPQRIEPALRVPIRNNVAPLGPMHRQEVIRVLDELLSPMSAERRPMRVASVNLAPLKMGRVEYAEAVGHMTMALRAESFRHPDTESLTFRIIHPLSLPARVRRDMETQLRLLCEELPSHRFVKTIAERVETEPVEDFIDPVSESDKLLRVCSEFMEVPLRDAAGDLLTKQLEEWRTKLELLSGRVQGIANEFLQSRVKTQLLTTHEGHLKAIEGALADAKEQIIFCSPTMRYETVQRVKPALLQALRRQVRVFLLWGSGPQQSMDTNVANLLYELRTDHPQLAFAQISARSNARMVVQDFRRAIISSHGFLDPGEQAGLVLGVLLEPVEESANHLLFSSLWSFCAATFPEFQLGQRIRCAAGNPEEPDAEIELGAAPELPALDGSKEARYSDASLALWREQWGGYAKRLADYVGSETPTCRLLVSSEHREVFWSIIRHSHHRLVIVSETLSTEVVTGKLLGVLQQRIDNSDIHIVIVYSDDQNGAVERLQDLAANHPNRLTLIKGPRRMSIELVAGDDTACVSSFRFMSFIGDYRGQQRWRIPAQVGVALRSASVVDEILATAARHFPIPHRVATLANLKPPPSMVATTQPHEKSIVGLPSLLAQLGAKSGDMHEQARILRDWFGAAEGTSWDALAVLQRNGVPGLPLAVASCLAVHRHQGLQPEAARWRCWLAADAWQSQRDGLQALWMARTIPVAIRADFPELPSPGVLVLAATERKPEALEAKLAGLSADFGAADVRCIAIAALTALLRFGFHPAAEALRSHRGACSGALGQLAEQTLNYFYQTVERFPLETILSLHQSQKTARTEEARYQELLTALDEMAHVKKTFGLVGITWEYIYGPGGALRKLDAAVHKRDVAAARQALREIDADPQDCDQLLDRWSMYAASQDKSWQGAVTISYGARGTCVRRVRSVLETLEGWLQAHASATAELSSLTPAAQSLSLTIGKLESSLRSAADKARKERAAEAPFIDNLLDMLGPVFEVTP